MHLNIQATIATVQNCHLLLASIARLKFDFSNRREERSRMIFLGNFDYKAIRTSATSFYGRYSQIIGPFHLSPRCSVRALVIILISINNANLSLHGIILGNDLESESRCIVGPLSCARMGNVLSARAERRLHRASRLFDRSTIDHVLEMDPWQKAESARSTTVIFPVTFDKSVPRSSF